MDLDIFTRSTGWECKSKPNDPGDTDYVYYPEIGDKITYQRQGLFTINNDNPNTKAQKPEVTVPVMKATVTAHPDSGYALKDEMEQAVFYCLGDHVMSTPLLIKPPSEENSTGLFVVETITLVQNTEDKTWTMVHTVLWPPQPGKPSRIGKWYCC